MPVIPYARYKKYPRPLQGGVGIIGGMNTRPQTLADTYRQAMDRANRANEQRYQQILAGYDDLHGRVMGDLANVGQGERADIERGYRNASAGTYSRLVNRGFGNSSLPFSMQRANDRDRFEAIGKSNERYAVARAGMDTAISQGKFGVMERRYDNAPDYAQMLALSQGLGRSGYGAGMQPIGAPIGIAPGAYQNAYQNFLMGNLAKMVSGPMYQGGPIQANIRAQQNRLRKVHQNLIPEPRRDIPNSPFALGPYGVRPSGPMRSGYGYPLSSPQLNWNVWR